MRRWQHKVVIHRVLTGQLIGGSAEDSEREEMLDSYGRDGWELTSVILQGYRREGDPTLFYGYTFFHYYFKREIQESEERTSEQELAVRGKKPSTTQPTEGTRDLEVSVATPSRGAIGGDRRFADALTKPAMSCENLTGPAVPSSALRGYHDALSPVLRRHLQ